MLTHGELFAGISGFGQGFARAGIRTAWHVEIDRHCQSILRRHHPDDLLLADVREAGAHNLAPVDIISFGSPCQDLSVAGRRAGLGGARSGLFFEAVRIVGELCPALALWENVPGALTSHAGRDFAAVLDALGELGPLALGWAVLDAQWFGVAQRRRRLFLVASFREWADPAEILALADGLSGHPAPRREAGAGVAAPLTSGARSGRGVNAPGRRQEDDVNLVPETAGTITARDGKGTDSDVSSALVVAHTLTGEGHDASEDGSGRGLPLVIEDKGSGTSPGNYSSPQAGDPCHPLAAAADAPTVALIEDRNQVARRQATVRPPPPRECERLQGFPDDYTAWGLDERGRRVELSDSARYRMLGNAVNVAVTAWLGGQIARVRHG